MKASDIKKYRKELKLTQEQLASELCVTRRALISWETGARVMPLCVEKLFCLLYGLPFVVPVKISACEEHPDLFDMSGL